MTDIDLDKRLTRLEGGYGKHLALTERVTVLETELDAVKRALATLVETVPPDVQDEVQKP